MLVKGTLRHRARRGETLERLAGLGPVPAEGGGRSRWRAAALTGLAGRPVRIRGPVHRIARPVGHRTRLAGLSGDGIGRHRSRVGAAPARTRGGSPAARGPPTESDVGVADGRHRPAGRASRGGLPLWNAEGLIAGIAVRPSGYHDLAGLAQWLPEVRSRLREPELFACLKDRPDAVCQRAAYLLRAAGAGSLADAVLAGRPPKHPVWFGSRRAGASYGPVAKASGADLARLHTPLARRWRSQTAAAARIRLIETPRVLAAPTSTAAWPVSGGSA